jgi:hypothetical protein
MDTWNKSLDDVLSHSDKTVNNHVRVINKTFTDMVEKVQGGVGTDKEAAVQAINDAREAVIDKLGGMGSREPVSAKQLNDVKRLVGDEVKKFSQPDNLTSNEKVQQEAYRQAYFKLRDMVSDLVPESKELNQNISKGFKAQDLLERKFPHLDTAEKATNSYNATRAAGAKKTVVKGAVKVATGGAIGYGADKLIDSLTGRE